MNATKDQLKLGVGSMAGMVGLGALSAVAPGTGPIVGVVGAGVGLANLGQALKTGKVVVNEIIPRTKKNKILNW